MGDLHHPLHVGYGIDRGGNTIMVSFLQTPSNLHRVWDSNIIEYAQITTAGCLEWYASYSSEQLAAIKTIDLVSWMNQSRLLLHLVYDFKHDTIDEIYITANTTIIEKQLSLSGIRLASLLEELFKG